MAGLGLVDIQPSVAGRSFVPVGPTVLSPLVGTSVSLINKLTNQINEMWST